MGVAKGRENITQIMWPSHYAPELRHSTLYRKLELLAQSVLGEDMSFDFDMMISKVKVVCYMLLLRD